MRAIECANIDVYCVVALITLRLAYRVSFANIDVRSVVNLI